MADIKTRDAVKGTIKKLDKAAIAADRMRSAYVQTKERAEHATHPEEHSAEEYASDRVEGGVEPTKPLINLISRDAEAWKKPSGICPRQGTAFISSKRNGLRSR